MELTIESALEVLREMFPDAVRVYISSEVDYFNGVLTTETFILIDHQHFRAPTLSEAMAQVWKWNEAQKRAAALAAAQETK